MSEKKTLSEALNEAEASNALAAKKRAEAVPEQIAEAVRLTAIQARLDALPQAQLRQVMDAAGLKHVSAAPVPIELLRGGAFVSAPPREKPARLRPGAIDWNLWKAMPAVKLWQACALLVGLNPERIFFIVGDLNCKGGFPRPSDKRQLEKVILLASSAVSYMHGPIVPRESLQRGADKVHLSVVLADVVAFFMSSRVEFNVPMQLQSLAPIDASFQMQGLKTATQAAKKTKAAPLAVAHVVGSRAKAAAPSFSMNRAGLISAHKHEWPTIEADIKYASENGLAVAKAGPRDWNEASAMEWARARGRLTSDSKPVNDLGSALYSMNKLPGRKHTLDG